MSAAALLADLDAAGVRLTRDADHLRYETLPGVKIDPFRERIIVHKPALLAELLKAEITAALNVEPTEFDRPAYLRLMARWYAAEADVAERTPPHVRGLSPEQIAMCGERGASVMDGSDVPSVTGA